MRFLFITKEYPPTPDPSGRIVFYIAEELVRKGHHVDVIARDNETHRENGKSGNIYWIKNKYWEKLSQKIQSGSSSKIDRLKYSILKYVRKLWLSFKLYKYPDSEVSTTKQIVATYDKYLMKDNIDCVVGFFRPYSCLSAAMTIRKNNEKIKCISCFLDLVESKDRPSFMPVALYNRLLRKGNLRVISGSDIIMLPTSAKKNKDLLFNKCRNAIYYEFPTFIIENDSSREDEGIKITQNNEIKMVFAGTMTKAFRSPEIMLEVLNKLAEHVSDYTIILDVFGGGDCSNMFASCSHSSNLIIRYHGKVSKEEVSSYEHCANILINIMNAYEAIVPSKIFELFATGKPIINFISQGDDGSLEYFKKYPLSYTVEWVNSTLDKKESIIKELSEFIIFKKQEFISVAEISTLFFKCTPRFVANQIVHACSAGEGK